jgi:hypothetical protein
VSAKTITPVRATVLPLPSRERVAAEVEELWRTVDASETGSRGGHNADWRCWGCRKFINGPTVTCRHCGQLHGGIYHEAYASR